MPPNKRTIQTIWKKQNGKFYENENFYNHFGANNNNLFIEFTKKIVLILKRISMNKKRIKNVAHAYLYLYTYLLTLKLKFSLLRKKIHKQI